MDKLNCVDYLMLDAVCPPNIKADAWIVFEQNLIRGLGCLHHFQQYFSYMAVSFFWWRKLEYEDKTTDLLQVTDKLSHNVVSSTPPHKQDSNPQL